MFACVYVLESENAFLGGSPGLVVMGGNSCSKGREFEYRHRILDGHDPYTGLTLSIHWMEIIRVLDGHDIFHISLL